MTPREALAEYGAVYQLGHCATGRDLSVHLRPDCPAVTAQREADRIDHPRRLPLRCSLCAACDPDHEERMSPEYDGVPAIEDHDDRPAWAPAEVSDD